MMDMIQEGNRVKVVLSASLAEMKIEEMAGRTGTVIEDLIRDRKNKGYIVQLDEMFMEEHLWFVPIDAVAIDN